MILVALTGPIGSGKTTLLEKLAIEVRNQGRIVDGFVAVAHHRVEAYRGAGRYILRWISTGEENVFAERHESVSPPYRFSEAVLEQASGWARGLAAKPPVSLLVLDEFGPMEARGGGHIGYWQLLRDAGPEVVVIAVRDTLLHEIQEKIGLPFDAVVDATSPDAFARLVSIVDQHPDWIRAGQFGAASGGFEATIGSILHGASVPLRGLFLSTMQAVFMLFAGERMRVRGRVVWVPFISAGLKALSPSGSRLRPMLAITTQGLLFGGATAVLGWNIVGVAIGGGLVGAWAASQGVLLQYLLIGQNYFAALDSVIHWVAGKFSVPPPGLALLLSIWILLWGSISASATALAWRRRHRMPERVAGLLAKGPAGVRFSHETQSPAAAFRHALHDILRPVFLVPILIVVAIVAITGTSWEGGAWIVIRAVTIGWVLFALVRMIRVELIITWLKRKGYWGPALAFSRAMSRADRSAEQPPQNHRQDRESHS